MESRHNWPDAEFLYYTEGFEVDCPGKDFRDMPEFYEWKMRHAAYMPPNWKWDVVRYAHKVFAACDALEGYKGVGVWLDADCVTHKPIPKGLIEAQVGDGVYLAHYARTGRYTETGMWIMDCSHEAHRPFINTWRNWYLSERYKGLSQWHDCFTLDATIRQLGVKTKNLSGEHHLEAHPQALTEFGKYIDHCKGSRKLKGVSPENKFRDPAV